MMQPMTPPDVSKFMTTNESSSEVNAEAECKTLNE